MTSQRSEVTVDGNFTLENLDKAALPSKHSMALDLYYHLLGPMLKCCGP